MDKTLAMKVLEGRKVAYEVVTYPTEERDAEAIARLLGVPPAELFKTLVVAREGQKPLLVMLPADRQLDLKKLAQATGDKKLHLATHAQAEALTGLQVGGISPLALLNKGFVVYLDDSATAHSHIYLSAGRRGLNLKAPVAALLAIVKPRLCSVVQ